MRGHDEASAAHPTAGDRIKLMLFTWGNLFLRTKNYSNKYVALAHLAFFFIAQWIDCRQSTEGKKWHQN